MIVYLASPASPTQANWLDEMPVLLSYGCWYPGLGMYCHLFDRILIDSGAFSELGGRKKIDGQAYRDWYSVIGLNADAIAGLDDIRGDWRRSLKNYQDFGGFPTIHDSDPLELLQDVIPIAREQGKNWLGIGLVPPRQGKESFVRWVCDNVPDDLHIHGWALRNYTYIRRLDSVDSTNWWRDSFKIKKRYPWLTISECLEIIVKRYKRESRIIIDDKQEEAFL
jgi:hypothetical protein